MKWNLEKGALTPFLFASIFFVLTQFVAPHVEGHYRFPKFYFYIGAFSFLIPFVLIKEKRMLPMVLFIIIAFISTLKYQLKWSYFSLFFYFLSLMLYVMLEKIDYEEKFLSVLYAIGIIWIVHGTLQWLNFDPITIAINPVNGVPDRSIKDPVIAFIGNPTWFGPTVAMAVPLIWMQRFGWIIGLGMSAVVVMTDSSGGMLSLIVAYIAMIFFLVKGRKKYVFFGILCISLVLIYYLYPMRAIYGSGGWFDENFRFRAWRDGFGFWKTSPWFGLGFGNWVEIFSGLTKVRYGATWLQAHNDWFQLFWETGIVGSVFALGMIFNVLASKVTNRKAIFYLSAILAISANALVSFPWHLPVTGCMTIICLERFFHYTESRDMIKSTLRKIGRKIYDRGLLPKRWAKCAFKKC